MEMEMETDQVIDPLPSQRKESYNMSMAFSDNGQLLTGTEEQPNYVNVFLGGNPNFTAVR